MDSNSIAAEILTPTVMNDVTILPNSSTPLHNNNNNNNNLLTIENLKISGSAEEKNVCY